MTDVLVITGLSGAGRSQAAADLEDLGWYVVDNLPSSLVPTIGDLAAQPGSKIDRLALAVGSSPQQADILGAIAALRTRGHRVRILYLEASTPELVKRYGATRRKHPLGDEAGTVLDAIERERVVMQGVRQEADLVIDTTGLTIHQLKARLSDTFAPEAPGAGMQTAVVSFGFKHGIPMDVDLVFDVRFLPNPYWVDDLRPLTGLDDPVRRYVLDRPITQEFLTRLGELLALLVPAYSAEGKSYLTVAVGCTGGRHRSVACAEEIARVLRRRGHTPRVQHRDLDRRD